MRKGTGHTAVLATKTSSVTVQIWQVGAKQNYCNFVYFNRVVNTKNWHNPNWAKYVKRLLENECILTDNNFLRIPSLISKDKPENIICTMGGVRRDF